MTNKEKYKNAFSVLHTSDDFIMEVEKMKNSYKKRKRNIVAAAAAAVAMCVVVGGSTSAYACNVGNIQRHVQIWLKGDQTDAIMNISSDGSVAEYEIIYQDEEGVEHTINGGGVAMEGVSGEERPLTEEEIMTYLNEPDVRYEEDGSVWIYCKDKKMEITDKFDEEGVCRVQVQGEDITYYITAYYKEGWNMSNDKFID
ncbi:MAG: hypothetical protein IJ291_01880 [Lachnospiraceae bacterium]|nr:hypothetical protein [Lachnospiraceae bacterium]